MGARILGVALILGVAVLLLPGGVALATDPWQRGSIWVYDYPTAGNDWSTLHARWYFNYGADDHGFDESHYVAMQWTTGAIPEWDPDWYNYVLAYNEPDNCGGGGSCKSPYDAAFHWCNYLQDRAWEDEVFLVGPSTLRTEYCHKVGDDSCGGVIDLDWYDNFLAEIADLCPPGYPQEQQIHWYGCTPAHLYSWLDATYAKYGKPLWLTEFGIPGQEVDRIILCGGNHLDPEEFMEAVIPNLDQHHVGRYAWFANRTYYYYPFDTGLVYSTGQLTPAGEAYSTILP